LKQKHKIGAHSATALVISAMVGTGVYTSLGFQVLGIQSVWAILILWLVGGLVAFCGSLVYGEVGSVLQGSGGEYSYLSKLYHPAVGFMSGFVSATVGFAAPIALSSMAFGKYVNTFYPAIPSKWLATLLILVISLVQLGGIKMGAVFQRLSTTMNLVLIGLFVAFGLFLGPYDGFSLSFQIEDLQQVFTSSFAISLVYVSYSYSGWNTSAYIAGEIDKPEKNLPLSLFGGTALVTLLYLALNFTFLYTVPISELAGKVEVGHASAFAIWGENGAKIVSVLISLGLLASVNAMSFVGARVTKIIASDFHVFRVFIRENAAGSPWVAQVMQTCIALALIHTSTFEHVLTYIGFTLSLFTCLVVGGVFILRKKYPNHAGFQCWGYPFSPLIFLAVDIYMLGYIVWDRPYQSLSGFATVGLGALVYYMSVRREE
jgi:APA family basic amino acid/polyamine antiporter